jgi:sensor histidine kinase YesM
MYFYESIAINLPFSPQRYARFSKLPAWLYHALFWTAYFGAATVIALSNRPIRHWTFFLQLLTLLPPDMLQVYLNIYILIPRLLFRQKYLLYFATLALCIFLHSGLFIRLHGVYAGHGETAFNYVKDFTVGNFLIQGLNIISLIGLATGIKLLKDWMRQERQWQEKEKQHIRTELDFLRTQIHPHFLFNTLNNLYSLTARKSDRAPEVVLKLSDLMSYMLYESGAPTVDLDKEIAHLENYIELEKLRYGSRLTLCFEKKGATGAVTIPPMLLITFVENSFKHGLKGRMGPVRIDISLRVEKNGLFLKVVNPADLEQSDTGGIGLKNVRRRLDILYEGRYDLHVERTTDQFQIKLKIPL